jgi:hypothetical protein
MDTPLETPVPDPMVQRIVDHLRAAQVGLLTAADSQANNATLLEAHEFVWQALTVLSRVATADSGSDKKVEATGVTARGARLL